jgi:hypothetical protein
MNIIQGWKQSLGLLKPSNLYSFLADALTLFKQSYLPWLKSFGGLILITLAYGIYFSEISVINGIGLLSVGIAHILNYPYYGILLLYQILIIFVFESAHIACRPALPSSSSMHYYKTGAYLAIWLFILGLINGAIRSGFSIIMSELGFYPPFHPYFIALLLTSIVIAGMLATWISSLFIVIILNSDGSARGAAQALLNAIRAILYALPFCILIGLIPLALYVAAHFIYQLIIGGITQIMSFMGQPVPTIYETYRVMISYMPLSIVLFELLVLLPLIASMTTIFYKKIYKTLVSK